MDQAKEQTNNLFEISRKKMEEQKEESKRDMEIMEDRMMITRSHSFLEEQRRSVIENENTAQEQFLDFLETLSPEITELRMREPLSGEIDLSILKECNFNIIDTIVFQKGKITHIRNIPLGIKYFHCPENLLIELRELPDTLIDLDIHNNYLKHINLDTLKNLKSINISNNQISRLYDFPNSIETIICDNNHLSILDLKGLDHLKKLHCSNNRMIRIENFPQDTIQDFIMENNPLTTIQTMDSNKDQQEKEEIHADVQESLETYFELKQQYEKAAYKMKKETYDRAPSKKAARELLKQIKPKCVNCKRSVGSIFITDKRIYIAKCGDQKAPCNLNLNIQAGTYINLIDFIQTFQTYVDDVKDDIIKQKLDTLFNYISESRSVQLFKENFDDYTEFSGYLKDLLDTYNEVYINEERELKMAKKMGDIFKIKERLNELFQKYKETDHLNILQDAMKVYMDQLKPEMNNLHLLKYPFCEIINVKSEYHLIQHTIPFNKRHIEIGAALPKVHHFSKN